MSALKMGHLGKIGAYQPDIANLQPCSLFGPRRLACQVPECQTFFDLEADTYSEIQNRLRDGCVTIKCPRCGKLHALGLVIGVCV